MTVFEDVSASIFLDLDTFASLNLSLNDGATKGDPSKGTTDAPTQLNGCVGVGGGMSVNAGAEGSFYDLFDNSTQVALFSKDIQLFQVGESHLSHRWNSEFLKCPYLRNVFRLQNQRVLVHQMAAVAPAAPLVLGRLLFPPILNF